MDDLLSLAVETEKQQRHMTACFDFISARGSNVARLDMAKLVKDVVNGDVFLEKPKMQRVSQGTWDVRKMTIKKKKEIFEKRREILEVLWQVLKALMWIDNEQYSPIIAAEDYVDDIELCEGPRLLINKEDDSRVGDRLVLGSRKEGQKDGYEFVDEFEKGEVEEEDIVAEATEYKRIWSRGGISFDSNDEEEVLERLEGKKRVDMRPKKQRNGRKPPCIQGRTLATRTLRLGAKFKLK
ncbi:hypothetical protein PIB30_037461 [Stylosanthes scabra]|uniref:Uncharacterized protein n=1 Tax=Stylosanthes scabra TaxID=79078 RepID=A0ABU6TFM3_9FABA|nr:hypothetical protein [Stylosanthes scabra]